MKDIDIADLVNARLQFSYGDADRDVIVETVRDEGATILITGRDKARGDKYRSFRLPKDKVRGMIR